MGANEMGYEMTEAEVNFIRKSWDDCSAYMTICGGVDALLKAGILGGKTVTAPFGLIPSLQQQHPGTNWVVKRWQRDGKLWTSGTSLNGLDLMRAFCFETWGEGKGDLIDKIGKMAAWPVRDGDFSDA